MTRREENWEVLKRVEQVLVDAMDEVEQSDEEMPIVMAHARLRGDMDRLKAKQAEEEQRKATRPLHCPTPAEAPGTYEKAIREAMREVISPLVQERDTLKAKVEELQEALTAVQRDANAELEKRRALEAKARA